MKKTLIGLNTYRVVWTFRSNATDETIKKKYQDMKKYIKVMEKKYKVEQIFINNGYGIEMKKLRKIL